MGRHGGRSADQLDHGVDIESRTTTFAGATALVDAGEGVTTLPAPLGGNRVGRTDVPVSPAGGLPLGSSRWWEDVDRGTPSVSVPPWWDEAPVPPPVVVASADGRTPAVSFAPDADPFSAGGVFAPPAARDGESAVVVHPAPDAAVLRGARRGRASGRGGTVTHDEVLTLLAQQDAGFDTGSLVRPYVTLAGDPPASSSASSPAPSPSAPASSPSADAGAPAPAAEVADPRPVRRARRSGGLDRVIDIAPGVPTPNRPVGAWQAPWSGEEAPSARSLFEPTVQPASPRTPWAAPAAEGLPSRKALRARERASLADTPSRSAREGGRSLTSRRLAKSGVLAVTAVGVVAASAPNAFSAFGWHLPSHPVNPSAQAALVGLAGSGSLRGANVSLGAAADSALLGATAPLSSPLLNDAAAARKDATVAAEASAAAAARAGEVASGAGPTLVDVARQQVLAEAARKAKIAQQVSRNIVRDPRAYAQLLLQERGWGDQYTCLNLLWNRESGWNYQAYNPSSGAFGIPQALPGSKMASIASDWRTNPATQIKWGLNYIAERYGTPCGAWSHSQATGWY